MPDKTNPVVFTDLDGTLLDHQTYSFHEAESALSLLRKRQVPLILASSKTAAEIRPLRKELGFETCEAIVENGAGILEPEGRGSEAAARYNEILQILAGLPVDLRARFEGFSQWSDDEVSRQTGLQPNDAAAARMRQFSEPGTWTGSDVEWQAFRELLEDEGLSVQRGGRFISLSFGNDKAAQMQTIIARYAAELPPFVIALGDAPNDVAMLEAADLGIIIPNPSHDGIPLLEGESAGTILRARHSGPEGWSRSIIELLSQAKE